MITQLNPEAILSFHNLKNTACRKMILHELLERKIALTEQELRKISGDLFDRVTFYRTIKTLEDAGIIHSIVIHNNLVKYAVSDLNKDFVHSHFYCQKCKQVQCLHDAVEVKTNLPAGFEIHALDIIINGTCKHCN